jgi:hypothetical protein
MAVARLGGGSVPLESFAWIEDPSLFGAGKTVIAPQVTLEVQRDGSILPYTPGIIRFHEGERLRPVAPFFELWATIIPEGETEAKDVEVTPDLLTKLDSSAAGVTYSVQAANLKAARRSGDPACGFVANIEVHADDNEPHALLAWSPNQVGTEPLVFSNAPIPLGSFRAIKPVSGTEAGVKLDLLRVRFTPAKGEVYGPPIATTGAAPGTGRLHEIVPLRNRILNPDAAWLKYDASYGIYDNPEPSDTYDGADTEDPAEVGPAPKRDPARAWGVVDDTCDAIIRATVVAGLERFEAYARAFSAPPDFAPDRRPFASLADELADRESLVSPPAATPNQQLLMTEAEVADLFQRVSETVSLINLDATRANGLAYNAGQVNTVPNTPLTDQGSMTETDKPYVDQIPTLLAAAAPNAHLPYSDAAKSVHDPLADVEVLVDFLRTHAGHVRILLRPPWGRFGKLKPNPGAQPNPDFRDPRVVRDTLHDMRMPPYMRDSDANPLSLTKRQYDEILQLVNDLQPPAPPAGTKAVRAALGPSTTPPLTPLRIHVERVMDRRKAEPGELQRSKPSTKSKSNPPKSKSKRSKTKSKPPKR